MSPKGQDHHFLPRFYLKRWAQGAPSLLCEFSRPRDVVKPRRTAPKGTGFVPKLYTLNEDSDGRKDRLEREFFMPVDTRAAEAMAAIESDLSNGAWDPKLRVAWSRFVMSLLMRMPEDLALLRDSYTREFAVVTNDMERRYRDQRQAEWPQSFAAAVDELSPQDVADSSKILATFLMQNERVTGALSAMYWTSLDVGTARLPLLTSDRPVQLSGQLGHRRTKLILPIGPGRLFIGGYDRAHANDIISLGPDRLVARTNRAVAEAADRYVYGRDDGALEFVRRHFRQARPKPLIAQLIEYVASKRQR